MLSEYLLEEKRFKESNFLKIPKFCLKKDREKCKNHYMNHSKGQFERCPYGFSTYKAEDSNKIYTGLIIEHLSDFKKITPKLEEIKNVYTKEEILNLIKSQEEKDLLVQTDKSIMAIMHEIRKLTNIIRKHADDSLGYIAKIDKLRKYEYLEDLKKIVQTTTIACDFLNLRAKGYDYLKNPNLMDSKIECFRVYSKFEKASHILDLVSKGKIESFRGKTHVTIEASTIFELLPFILLENAIKYSEGNKKVKVLFEEDREKLEVTIENMGPYAEEEEILLLLENGYRSKNSRKLSEENTEIDGQGIGLFVTKEICSKNGIGIEITSDKSKKFKKKNVEYAPFKVKLTFKINN